MQDFLLFNDFIAQDVLLFFYYVAALSIPFLFVKFRSYFYKRIFSIGSEEVSLENFYTDLAPKQKMWVLFGVVTLFVSMELCLRMCFEAMIGYFDMHDYLHTIMLELQKNNSY